MYSSVQSGGHTDAGSTRSGRLHLCGTTVSGAGPVGRLGRSRARLERDASAGTTPSTSCAMSSRSSRTTGGVGSAATRATDVGGAGVDDLAALVAHLGGVDVVVGFSAGGALVVHARRGSTPPCSCCSSPPSTTGRTRAGYGNGSPATSPTAIRPWRCSTSTRRLGRPGSSSTRSRRRPPGPIRSQRADAARRHRPLPCRRPDRGGRRHARPRHRQRRFAVRDHRMSDGIAAATRRPRLARARRVAWGRGRRPRATAARAARRVAVAAGTRSARVTRWARALRSSCHRGSAPGWRRRRRCRAW